MKVKRIKIKIINMENQKKVQKRIMKICKIKDQQKNKLI
jgi:hypothetical protein